MTGAMAWMLAGLILLGVVLLLRKPLGRLCGVALRSCGALAILAALQQLGGIAGVTLGVNLANALILAILGIPGFGLLLMLSWLLR